MTPEELVRLINQQESPSLEFKRELHRIFDKDSNVKGRHRDEFIRDILSLANGNTTTAGENAYLIIGVDDDYDPDIGRYVYGVTGKIPTRREILSIVRPASDPPVEDLICEPINTESKTVIVITILPSPHIHETTRRLEPIDGKHYSEHVVFMRSGDSIQIASAKERRAIQDIKSFRYADSLRANPIALGGVVGAAVAGSVANACSARDDMPIIQRGFVAFAYGIMGGIFGAVMGRGYSSILQFRRELQPIPKRWRIPITSGIICVTLSLMYAMQKVVRRLLSHLNPNS